MKPASLTSFPSSPIHFHLLPSFPPISPSFVIPASLTSFPSSPIIPAHLALFRHSRVLSRHSREGGNPEVRLLLDKETEPIVSISYLPRLWYHVWRSQSVKER